MERMLTVIDPKELEQALIEMKPWHPVFKLIKAEMIKRGHWKNRPRGKPTLKNLE
jgi:hypothetical protein